MRNIKGKLKKTVDATYRMVVEDPKMRTLIQEKQYKPILYKDHDGDYFWDGNSVSSPFHTGRGRHIHLSGRLLRQMRLMAHNGEFGTKVTKAVVSWGDWWRIRDCQESGLADLTKG